MTSSANPRYANGHRRRQLRNRVKARRDPCALCGLPIDYDLPVGDPMSYELDEIIPVSRGGDPLDISNVQPSHRICNQRKSNKILEKSDFEKNRPPWSREW